MDFRLLGPFEVESDGRDLTPARRKQQLLLATLVLKANEVVATDDLVEILWGPTPPATAHKALHGHVSALRKLLGPEKIETRPPGYLIHAHAASVDAHRFEALVETAREEADPDSRRELLRGALTLFRGEPLADFRYEPFAREEAARLEQLRLRALEDRIDAELELGRHSDAIPELERLVGEHPYEERLRAALMLALYRSGRQAQALQVYADGRRRLVDDLGIDPGPSLQQLERQILNQEAALMPAAARRSEGARRAPTNLSHPAALLIGRERELQEVRSRLLGEAGRLWTMTGAAGTGKTSLAVQAAVDLLEQFPDGTFLVALAPIADPDLVLPTIADVVGVDTCAAASVAEVLEQRLTDSKLLLVLDNFEHVLEAAPAVSRLVAATHNLEVLATSREPLHVGGEHVYPLPPLALPARDTLLEVAASPAVKLFVERTQALRPDFELSESNASAVAEICRRLDGLPLAIELAAARIPLFPPAALLDRLDKRFALLTGGGRDQPQRHQTLRAAIDWSYQLLAEPDQALLARLSVFAGGWTLEAAEAVCDGDLDVVDGLASLIDKNLIQLQGTEQEPRFTILETIREYGREQLEGHGEVGTCRRHAEYFLDFAEQLGKTLSRPSAEEGQRRLFAELDNFRAAMKWAVENDAGELALRMIWPLWRFWRHRSLEGESHDWYEAAVAAAPEAPPEVRGRALLPAAETFYVSGRAAEYRRESEEAVRLLRGGDDAEAPGYALASLSVAMFISGETHEAELLGLEALALAEERGYDELAGRVNVQLGVFSLVAGDVGIARARLESAAKTFEEIGYSYGRSLALENLASTAVLEGDFEGAACALSACLDAWDLSQHFHNLGHSLVVAAAIAQAHGDAPLGARLLGSVEALFERVNIHLEPVEASIGRETRLRLEADLGTTRYTEEWARGAGGELAEELAGLKEALRRWATAGARA